MLRPYSSFLCASNSLPAQQCTLRFTCIFSSLDSNVWRWSLCTWNILKKRKWKSLLYFPFLSSIFVWFCSLRIAFFIVSCRRKDTFLYEIKYSKGPKSSTTMAFAVTLEPLWNGHTLSFTFLSSTCKSPCLSTILLIIKKSVIVSFVTTLCSRISHSNTE